MHVCAHTHTYSYTLTLFFSSSHFGFKHNSFAWKKANCILQQKKSREECCLPSALAPIAQAELGLNEYRAGQPEPALTPLFQSRAGNRNTGERDSPLQHRPTHTTNKAWRAWPSSFCQGFCRLEKMPTQIANRWGRQTLVAAKS